MAKKITICLFYTILSVSIFAAPAEVVYQEIIDGADNFVHIDPLLDTQNELSGFIYTDSVNSQIIIDEFTADSLIIIGYDDKPVKTLHYKKNMNDTLFLFSISIRNAATPILGITKIVDNNIVFNDQRIINSYSMYSSAVVNISITHLDIKFSDNYIIVESNKRFTEYYTGIGLVVEDIPTSAAYNKDNFEFVVNYKAAKLYSGKASDLNDFNFVSLSHDYYMYDASDPDNQEINYSLSSLLSIFDESNNETYTFATDYHGIYEILLDNFQPSSSLDALIYYGSSTGLLDDHLDDRLHIACYSFSGGTPYELWYNDDIGDITLDYVFKQKDLILGTRGGNEVIMLDYLNGQVTDSANLLRETRNINFFETGLDYTLLNLVCLNHDTVFVYQFDMPTAIYDPIRSPVELPANFTLMQNHPNPFNNDTRLEFSNEQNQYLTLKIYNILGQEIKSLAKGTFSPGNYAFYWNGHDENGLIQSTGVYFARLESDMSTQMIKLIYLK